MEEPPTWDQTIARAMLALTANVIPATGAVIEPLMVVFEDVRARRAHRAEVILMGVADGVGGPKQLGDRLRQSPNHEAQFVQAIEEAIRTGHEAKRALLVRAVVNSLRHDELYDESQLIIDALTQLDVMQIRALARLDQELDPDGAWVEPLHFNEDGSVTAEDEKRGNGRSPAWQALPEPLQAALARAGVCTLMRPTTIWPSRSDRPTEGISTFGRYLLAELRSEAEDAALG